MTMGGNPYFPFLKAAEGGRFERSFEKGIKNEGFKEWGERAFFCFSETASPPKGMGKGPKKKAGAAAGQGMKKTMGRGV